MEEQLPWAWERYRHNPVRQLTALAIHTERTTLHALTDSGYPQLVMAFSGPLGLLARRPRRLTDLAESLGVSKQLCLQSLKPIEAAGYIQRRPDPEDKRAKLLALSALGQELVEQAIRELSRINRHFEKLLGKRRLAQLTAHTARLSEAMQIPELMEGGQVIEQALLAPMLGAVTRECHRRLMEADIAAGHPRLQPSYGQVLVNINLAGTAMAAIAQQNGVSTQAISRIARELEAHGYIQRRAAPDDARSTRLYFTAFGLRLIIDSTKAMTRLEEECERILGRKAFEEWCKSLAHLYQSLDLEPGLVGPYSQRYASAILADAPPPAWGNEPDTAELLRYLATLLLPPGSSAEDIDALLHKGLRESVDPERIAPLVNEKLGKRKAQSLVTLLSALTRH